MTIVLSPSHLPGLILALALTTPIFLVPLPLWMGNIFNFYEGSQHSNALMQIKNICNMGVEGNIHFAGKVGSWDGAT